MVIAVAEVVALAALAAAVIVFLRVVVTTRNFLAEAEQQPSLAALEDIKIESLPREKVLLSVSASEWADKAAVKVEQQAARAVYYAEHAHLLKPGHPWLTERAGLVADGQALWLDQIEAGVETCGNDCALRVRDQLVDTTVIRNHYGDVVRTVFHTN